MALAAVQLADLATTAYASAHGGLEVNPVIRAALAVGGIPAMFALKAWVWGVCAYIAMTYQHKRSVRIVVVVGIVMTALVAANNLYVGGF